MDAVAINVLPVKDEEHWRRFIAQAESGELADEHRAMLKRVGVDREHIFFQRTPDGATMLLVWEGIEPDRAAQAMGELITDPQSDYERTTIDHVLRDLHGIDPESASPPPPVEKVATIEP